MMTQEGCFRSDKPYAGRWELNFGIKSGDKVLDIGSGDRPFPYATHLLDMKEGNPLQERYGNKVITPEGKVFINGSAEDMSMFGDNEFDFIYTNHTIEHIENLPKALDEISRVGKRGFVACPSYEWEVLLRPRRDGHIWFISYQDDVLHIRRRKDYEYDDFLSELMTKVYWGIPELARHLESHNCVGARFIWEIRFFWEDKIDYVIDESLFPNGKLMEKYCG
mgnify:FL=1